MITSPITPAAGAIAITPNDEADLTHPVLGLILPTAGDVKVDMLDGSSGIVLPALTAGVIHWVAVKKVYDTGTTPTSMIGVF